MFRLFLVIMCIAQAASAKDVSLWGIPDDFTFETDTATGPYIVDFAGIEDGLYRFDTTTPTSSNPHWIFWRNAKSQTLRATDNTKTEYYTPHDCLNLSGECDFVFDWGDGRIDDVTSTTRTKDNVSYIEYYIVYDTGPSFWYLDCVTYDRYGFTIDMFQIDFEGDEDWQQRTSSSTGENSRMSIYKLKKLCHAAYDARTGELM